MRTTGGHASVGLKQAPMKSRRQAFAGGGRHNACRSSRSRETRSLGASPPSDGGYLEVTLEISLRVHPDTERSLWRAGIRGAADREGWGAQARRTSLGHKARGCRDGGLDAPPARKPADRGRMGLLVHLRFAQRRGAHNRTACLGRWWPVSPRQVTVRPGRHFGWWVEGRRASGSLFMKTWWPTRSLAQAVARWIGARDDSRGWEPRSGARGLFTTLQCVRIRSVVRGSGR